jgi:hypothetical protein
MPVGAKARGIDEAADEKKRIDDEQKRIDDASDQVPSRGNHLTAT